MNQYRPALTHHCFVSYIIPALDSFVFQFPCPMRILEGETTILGVGEMARGSTLPGVRLGRQTPTGYLGSPVPRLPPLLCSLCLSLCPSLQVPVLRQQRLPLPLVQVSQPLHSRPHHLLLPGRPDQYFGGKQGSPWHGNVPSGSEWPPFSDGQSNSSSISAFFQRIYRLESPVIIKLKKWQEITQRQRSVLYLLDF